MGGIWVVSSVFHRYERVRCFGNSTFNDFKCLLQEWDVLAFNQIIEISSEYSAPKVYSIGSMAFKKRLRGEPSIYLMTSDKYTTYKYMTDFDPAAFHEPQAVQMNMTPWYLEGRQLELGMFGKTELVHTYRGSSAHFKSWSGAVWHVKGDLG